MATEAQLRANYKYHKKTYDRIEIYVKKELNLKEKIEEHCQEYGYLTDKNISGKKTNRAAFITKAIETQMAIDSGKIKVTYLKEE